MRILIVLAAFASASAVAQEIVTLRTRPGVTLSLFVPASEAKPEAVALILNGGGGNIGLREEGGQIRFGQRNFLLRSRGDFARNGVLPVLLDNPSDQQRGDGMSDSFRESPAHVTDLRQVTAEVKRRFPGLPVFVVGTSRSTLSAAHLGASLGDELAGVVLTSSYFNSGGNKPSPRLASFNWSRVRVPLLLVHHREDTCRATPYEQAARLAARFTLISVKGGKPAESHACDPLSPHGYYGIEAPTVDAITAWMLKRPFAKEIG